MIYLTGSLFLILYFGLCVFALASDRDSFDCIEFMKSLSVRSSVIFIGVCFVPIVLIFYWSGQDHCIYYWDFAGYWSSSINQMHYMESHTLFECLGSVYRSINTVPYNSFLSCVVALPLHVLGVSHRKFVLINCILFYLPTIAIVGLTTVKTAIKSAATRSDYYLLFITGCISALLVPSCYYPTLRGYIDIAFLLPSATAMYLLTGYDYSRKSYSKDISLSLLFVLIWICRRYAVYLIVGLVASLIVRAAKYLFSNSKNLYKVKDVVRHLITIGGISLGILTVLFRPFLLTALINDYSESYSAYNAATDVKIHSILSSYGAVLFFICIITCVLCIILKLHRVEIVSLLIIGIVELMLFWQTQDMDIHHRMLLYLPTTLIINMSAIIYCYYIKRRRKHYALTAFWGICAGLLVINFSNAFITRYLPNGAGNFFASAYQPIVRNDIHNLESLTEQLKDLTKESEKGIYVAAAADILNVDIIRKFRMPDSDVAVNNLLGTSDIDLRDGFPIALSNADYIVCTDPTQTHLDAGQEIVRYINQLVQNPESCIGRHYKEVFQITLDRETIAKIYQRESNLTPNDLRIIADYFSDIYPDKEELFANRILNLLDY